MTIAAPQTAPAPLSLATGPIDRVRAVPARPTPPAAVVRRILFLLGLGVVMLFVQLVIGVALLVSFSVAAVRALSRRLRRTR